MPRVVHGFRGRTPRDRYAFLASYYALVVSRAIAQEGQHPASVRGYREGVTQAEMASKAGCHQTTISRRIGRLQVPVITRKRRFGMASRYGVQMPGRREMWCVLESSTGAEVGGRHYSAAKACDECDRLQEEATERGAATVYQVEAVQVEDIHRHAPSIAELAADAAMGEWWDAEYRSDGYKEIDLWIWHPGILHPDTRKMLGTFPRLLMSYYKSKGLLEEFKAADGSVTKRAGLLEILQGKVARELGVTVKTVYRANCLWERLGVLRIAAGNPRKTATGHKQGPQIVLYVPFRILTDAEAELEAERMARAVRELAASQYASDLWGRKGALLQAVEAMRVHRELLAAWRGQEHCLVAFWREAARRMAAAGILHDFTRHVLPPCAAGGSRNARPPGSYDPVTTG